MKDGRQMATSCDRVLQGTGRQLATPCCKGPVASWGPRPARDRSPAGDQFRDGLVALWRSDRMMVLIGIS
ncbi:hypothetical protein Bca4012_044560 [Brassica carinata]